MKRNWRGNISTLLSVVLLWPAAIGLGHEADEPSYSQEPVAHTIWNERPHPACLQKLAASPSEAGHMEVVTPLDSTDWAEGLSQPGSAEPLLADAPFIPLPMRNPVLISGL